MFTAHLEIFCLSSLVSVYHPQMTIFFPSESIRIIELVKLEPSYDEGWSEAQLGKMTNIIFLGIRDAYLRSWNKYGPTRVRSLSDTSITPNARRLLFFIPI